MTSFWDPVHDIRWWQQMIINYDIKSDVKYDDELGLQNNEIR